MAINPMAMFQLKERLQIFNEDHPRVIPFMRAVGSQAILEGTVLELKVVTPEGREFVTNIRLNANDLETIEILKKQQKN